MSIFFYRFLRRVAPVVSSFAEEGDRWKKSVAFREEGSLARFFSLLGECFLTHECVFSPRKSHTNGESKIAQALRYDSRESNHHFSSQSSPAPSLVPFTCGDS